MSFVQLPFIRRLWALGVEDWVDKTGRGWLSPVIYLEVNEEVIVGSKVEISAAEDQPLTTKIRGLSVVDPGVGISSGS